MEDFIDILEASFERALRRDSEKQIRLYNAGKFNIITHYIDDKPVGIITYWEKEDFLYCEHFAVDPKFRGRGIGRKMFKEFMTLPKIKILDCEPPNSETNIKRIQFYESLSMKASAYEYLMPPYHKDTEPVRLIIMSSQELSKEAFHKYTEQIKECIRA